jgi:RNA polymerase sigma-70 factor, ECF subfamily
VDLYGKYRPALLRKAERMLRSHALAEDVVQTLFVDVLEENVRTHDFPYLFRAVSNRCLNVLRDSKRRNELLLRRVERPTFCTREAESVMALDLLLKLASSLEPEVAEAVAYAHFDEMTQDEIAELMGLSRKTIGKYLSEAQSVLATLAGEGA